MSDTRANVEITATSNRLGAALRQAAGKFASWAGGIRAGMKRMGESAAGSALGNVAGNLASRGFDVITDQAKAVMGFEKNLTRLGIAGTLSKGQLDTLRSTARKLSSDVGIGADDILAGAQTYVDLTGDVKGATGSMELFARVAQASGSSVSDVAQASAAFKGIGIEMKDLEATFGGLITQGKAGAVSLKDFAGELASLAPRWAKFNESTTTQGIAQLGAAFQVARQGFGSASEAATGLQATMGALTQNAKKFEAAGVKIFDKNPKTGAKTLRTFEQIMKSIEGSKLVRDPTLMTKALGSKEAEQTVTMLLKARKEITATGTAYSDLVAAGMDAGAVQRDLDTYLESSSGKMEKAWERVKNTIAEALTPERIEAFANAMGELAEKVGPLMDFLGAAGDVLGGISGVGKSLVGFANGESNPWKDEELVAQMQKSANGYVLGGDNSDAAMKARLAKADESIAGAQGFRAARDNIMGGEVNERTTKDSIRRAVLEAYHGGTDTGTQGRNMAGSAYLNAAGVKPEEGKRIMTEAVGDAFKSAFSEIGGGKLVDALAALAAQGKPEVRIGDNQIAKSAKTATSAQRKP